MKCAVFNGKCNMTIDEREIPEPAADEVLIKIMACGVCGSDVHYFFGDQGSTSSIPPLIQGHEFSGVVVKIGKDVVECKVGDKVCADPADNCNDCYYCAMDDESLLRIWRLLASIVMVDFAILCCTIQIDSFAG